MLQRCDWAGTDPIYHHYHDTEWGVPLHDERRLFEFLILEGMQAGLSWLTILKKRANFRRAFDDFDYEKVARYDNRKRAALLDDAGIIRNRLKIDAAISNAKAFIEVREKHGSFDTFIWRYVDHEPIQNCWRSMVDVPAKTSLAETIAKDLKKLGFSFVGPTIVYAHMQATGMVNDHLESCFRHPEVQGSQAGST